MIPVLAPKGRFHYSPRMGMFPGPVFAGIQTKNNQRSLIQNMKTNSIISGVAACLIAVSLTACDKAKNEATKAADAAKDAAGSAVDATKDAAGKAMDAAKDAATAAMTNAPAAAASSFTDTVAAAKKALEEKNYQGVLDELKKLSDTQLSPEQQSVVDGLKAEATKMLSGAAADAAKAALGK